MIDQPIVDRIGEYIQAHQGSGRCVSMAEIAYRLDLPGQTVLEVADGCHTYKGGCLQANYDQICPNADLFVERLMRRGIGP
jgi:hypothetical protein